MANRRWKIDPSKTAMENLYDAANTACRYILSRSKVQLKSNDERKELLDLCIYKGVEIFLKRYIQEKKYDRKYTFFQNVYSACWSCYSYVIDLYLTSIKRRLSTTDKMETLSYDQDCHPLRTDSQHDKSAVLTAIERQSLFDCNRVSMCVAEDALKYIWECEDEANEYDHKTIDYAAAYEHRAQVLQRVRDLVNGGHSEEYLRKRVYNREYNRKKRAKAKVAARNRANPQDPGPSPRRCRNRDK